jgi:hypothetical protein
MGQLRLNRGKTQFFLKTGLSSGIAIKTDDVKEQYSMFFGTEQSMKSVTIREPKKFELGYLFGAKVTRGKIGLELRYEYSNGMSPYAGLNVNVSRLYALVGYQF